MGQDLTVTAEQLMSRVPHPAASLIGPGETPIGIADRVRLGRDRDACEVAVVHPSVSAVHARFDRDAGGWRVIDLGSRNGTEVDGGAAGPVAALRDGARLRVGDVELRFVAAAPPARARRRTATAPAPVPPPAVLIATDAGAFEVAIDRGLVRGAAGAVALSQRERALIELLIDRRAGCHPDLAYLPGAALAGALGFRSLDADGENVRELVLRVRRKLRAIGADRLVETRRNAGYRLGGAVTRGTLSW